ncbi:MAG TPA: hypothetical protein DDZ51_17550 [Planctomycetaceae bacterium]|nr:hypothetical protein [Planctomycetaceae bacterium]
MPESSRPDFFCIGAQRAGTTWLHSRLNQHPNFFLPPLKELHYFDRSPRYPTPNTLNIANPAKRLLEFERAKWAARDVYRCLRYREWSSLVWLSKFHFGFYGDSWYRSLFPRDSRITSGDITPGYSVLDEEGVRRMHLVAPQAKIIFILRNPIDRAWSMMRFGKRFGYACDPQRVEEIFSRIDSPGQELRSDYLRAISIYRKFYPAEKILLVFYDAIPERPQELLSQIFHFLGISPISFDALDSQQRVNEAEELEIPDSVRSYLEDKYRDPICAMAELLGGYASNWKNRLFEQPESECKSHRVCLLASEIA